jgi:hypothetical protein
VILPATRIGTEGVIAVNTLRIAAPTLLIAAVLAVAALDANAQGARPDPAEVQQRIEQAKTRLNLTPDQQAKLRPVMEERARKMKAIRDKHAGDTSRSAKRAMFKEARPVQQEYEAQVKAILTEPQFKEWEEMRSEARAAMREQYRNKQSSE